MSTDDVVKRFYERLNNYSPSHALFDAYYEGEIQVPTLGISIPPVLQRIQLVVGWPSICVDVLEERLDFLGWDDDGKYGLEDLYVDCGMANESSLANIDSLLYGISFLAISTGSSRDDEPKALITGETAKNTTGVWNRRTRRLDEAFTRYPDEAGKFTKAVHYLPDSTHYYRRKDENSPWVSDGKPDNHRLGRVPVVRLPNRGRAGRLQGKSEITKSIRSHTDTAVRTLLGMEVNREFYSSPQRYVLGADEKAFTDETGNPIPGWKANMGALWRLSRDKEWAEQSEGRSDGLPTVGQFGANPPGPYLEQVRGLAQMISADGGIPVSYFGFGTDNPPSADSIRATEARLVKRAERRISAWDPGYLEAGLIAAEIATGRKPKRKELVTSWRDPATPTKSADADRASKLVGAGLLPANSRVAREMAGLTPKQIRQLEKEERKAQFMKVLTEGMGSDVPTDQSAQPSDTEGNGNPVDSEQPTG